MLEKNKTLLRVSVGILTTALYIGLGYISNSIPLQIAEILSGVCIIFPYGGLFGNLLGSLILSVIIPFDLFQIWYCMIKIPALVCIILLRDKGYLKYLSGLLYAIIIAIYFFVVSVYIGYPNWLLFIQVLISETIWVLIGIFLFEYLGKYINLDKSKDS